MARLGRGKKETRRNRSQINVTSVRTGFALEVLLFTIYLVWPAVYACTVAYNILTYYIYIYIIESRSAGDPTVAPSVRRAPHRYFFLSLHHIVFVHCTHNSIGIQHIIWIHYNIYKYRRCCSTVSIQYYNICVMFCHF